MTNLTKFSLCATLGKAKNSTDKIDLTGTFNFFCADILSGSLTSNITE
ncbi:hypothetical protein HOG27_05950 [bacterium]|nr:hypothetical protein [bacterium]MBT5492011.1 hypothetical protein [bacterium]MBT6779464.1 hypothetical protein [bacterium]